MNTISIMPENPGTLTSSYRAIAGNKQSLGRTPGEALDAITPQLETMDNLTLVILQHLQPDQFFTAQQQERLAELMSRWRQARDAGSPLPPEEQGELDALIQTEVRGAGARAAVLLQGLRP